MNLGRVVSQLLFLSIYVSVSSPRHSWLKSEATCSSRDGVAAFGQLVSGIRPQLIAAVFQNRVALLAECTGQIAINRTCLRRLPNVYQRLLRRETVCVD